MTNFGLGKLLKRINIYNMENEFTYEFNEGVKSIIVKYCNSVSTAPLSSEILFEKAIKSTFEFIYPIVNPI